MKLTKREEAMEQARQSGYAAYEKRTAMPMYDDKGLIIAWQAGYNEALRYDKAFWNL